MTAIYVDALKRKGKFKNWSRLKIEEMLEDKMNKKVDVFLSAQEAVEWGFADEIHKGF